MKNQNTCVNSHSKTAITDHTADFGCSFTKVTKNGKPALLACINIHTQLSSTETLSALMHHAEELNVRLPFLRVSVRISSKKALGSEGALGSADQSAENSAQENHLFVLHGLSPFSMTKPNVSEFLNRLTHDFKVFLAYAKAHNIQIEPDLEASAMKPFG